MFIDWIDTWLLYFSATQQSINSQKHRRGLLKEKRKEKRQRNFQEESVWGCVEQTSLHESLDGVLRIWCPKKFRKMYGVSWVYCSIVSPPSYTESHSVLPTVHGQHDTGSETSHQELGHFLKNSYDHNWETMRFSTRYIFIQSFPISVSLCAQPGSNPSPSPYVHSLGYDYHCEECNATSQYPSLE